MRESIVVRFSCFILYVDYRDSGLEYCTDSPLIPVGYICT